MDLNSLEIQEIMAADATIASKIDQLLELSLSKKQIMSLGFKEATVRAAINKRKELGKPVAESGPRGPSLLPVIVKGTEAILPEYVGREIAEYLDGSAHDQIVFKSGLFVPLLGIRLFTEMVKPLTALINAMKGEQLAAMQQATMLGQQQASQAAAEASMQTATAVIAAMKEGEEKRAIAGSRDPVQAMFAQAMLPMFQNVISSLMGAMIPKQPGQQPPGQQPGQQTQGQPLPTGWLDQTIQETQGG